MDESALLAEPSKCPVCKGSKCASCDQTGLALCHCNEPCWRDTHLCEGHYKQMLARWALHDAIHEKREERNLDDNPRSEDVEDEA